MRSNDKFTILMDRLPTARVPARICDYSDESVLQAVYPPLLPLGKARVGTELAHVQDADRSCVRLRLQDRVAWSTGEPLMAQHVLDSWRRDFETEPTVRGLLKALLGTGDPLQKLRVDGARDMVLDVPDRRRNLLVILSALQLSPTRPLGGTHIGTGKYKAAVGRGQTCSSAVLTLVQAKEYEDERNLPREVVLREEPDPHVGLQLWREGIVDITCNTAFPAASLSRPKLQKHLNQHILPLLVDVVIDPHWLGSAGIPNSALIDALDYRALYEALGSLIAPLSNVAHFIRNLAKISEGSSKALRPDARILSRDVPRATAHKPQASLTLAYCEFYPNRLICEWLADCWRRIGVRVHLQRSPYPPPSDWSSLRADGVLRISGPIFPHPSAMLLALELNGAPRSVREARAMCLLHGVGVLDGKPELVAYLNSHPTSVPIAQLNGHSLVAPRVKGFRVDGGRVSFDPGSSRTPT